jgi:hypothetical protein
MLINFSVELEQIAFVVRSMIILKLISNMR